MYQSKEDMKYKMYLIIEIQKKGRALINKLGHDIVIRPEYSEYYHRNYEKQTKKPKG